MSEIRTLERRPIYVVDGAKAQYDRETLKCRAVADGTGMTGMDTNRSLVITEVTRRQLNDMEGASNPRLLIMEMECGSYRTKERQK